MNRQGLLHGVIETEQHGVISGKRCICMGKRLIVKGNISHIYRIGLSVKHEAIIFEEFDIKHYPVNM